VFFNIKQVAEKIKEFIAISSGYVPFGPKLNDRETHFQEPSMRKESYFRIVALLKPQQAYLLDCQHNAFLKPTILNLQQAYLH